MTNRLYSPAALCLITSLTLTSVAAKYKKQGGSPGQDQAKQTSSESPPPAPASQPSPANSVDNSGAHKAQSDLLAAQTAARLKYESDPDWLAAMANLKQAQAENDSAITPVMSTLKADSNYKSAVTELTKDEAKLSELRTSESSDGAAMSEAAGNAMSARATIRSLEVNAVNSDPAASAAAQKLKGAVDAMTALRANEAKSIAAAPEVISARQAVDAVKPSAQASNK